MDELPRKAPDTDETEHRLAPRDSLLLGAEIAGGGDGSAGRIRNLSATGAFVEIAGAFSVGDLLHLKFRGVGHIEAVVARTTAKGIGVRFSSPIDPALGRKSVLPPEPDWTKDYVLCLREGGRRAIWDTDADFKRPPVSRR
jgi:hypothetical protein